MTFPLKLKTAKIIPQWSGGGLLVLLSLGLHGLALSWPLPSPPVDAPPPLEVPSAPPDAAAVMDVVRLPAASGSVAAPLAEASLPGSTAAPPTTRPPQLRVATPRETQELVEQPAPAEPEQPAPVEPDPLPPSLDDRLRDPEEYDFNQEVKSLVANEFALHTAVVPDWLEREGRGLGDDEIPIMGSKLAPIQVAYPIGNCLTPPPAEGLVGVIVTPAGQLVKAPTLLDSTGYTVLDEKALELASQQAFVPLTESNGMPNPRAHWLPVQVQYDAASCTP